jgi:phosphatidylglycerophosphate synthase
LISNKYGKEKALDLSDWGRPIARVFARFLKDKPVSVIQVTNLHFILTLFCAWLILQGQIILSCLLLVVKGVVDAIDGELARIRLRPSHVGRYWDTIVDVIGLVVVVFAFGKSLEWEYTLVLGMIFSILIQYSLFNHFSLRIRASGLGDTTSRVDERKCPTAYPWENQKNVERLHAIYVLCFSWQDRFVTTLSGPGTKELKIELTASSILGFGFQSLILVSLAVIERIDLLPMIVLFANNLIFVFVILCSRLLHRRSDIVVDFNT